MNDEKAFSVIESETNLAETLESLDPKKNKDLIELCEFFIERTNCIIERTK